MVYKNRCAGVPFLTAGGQMYDLQGQAQKHNVNPTNIKSYSRLQFVTLYADQTLTEATEKKEKYEKE